MESKRGMRMVLERTRHKIRVLARWFVYSIIGLWLVGIGRAWISAERHAIYAQQWLLDQFESSGNYAPASEDEIVARFDHADEKFKKYVWLIAQSRDNEAIYPLGFPPRVSFGINRVRQEFECDGETRIFPLGAYAFRAIRTRPINGDNARGRITVLAKARLFGRPDNPQKFEARRESRYKEPVSISE